MGNPEQSRIRLRGSARTSTGQVRQNNEDNIHLWSHDYSLVAIFCRWDGWCRCW